MKNAEAAKEEKKVIPLNQTKIRQAEYVRNVHFAIVPPGTSVTDLEDPAYWRNVGGTLRQFDRVEAVTEDSTWYAEFIVLATNRLWAKLHRLSFTDLSPSKKDIPATDDQNFAVEWKGPLAKFVVIRKADSAILKDGFETQLQGHQWLDGYLKSMAA